MCTPHAGTRGPCHRGARGCVLCRREPDPPSGPAGKRPPNPPPAPATRVLPPGKPGRRGAPRASRGEGTSRSRVRNSGIFLQRLAPSCCLPVELLPGTLRDLRPTERQAPLALPARPPGNQSLKHHITADLLSIPRPALEKQKHIQITALQRPMRQSFPLSSLLRGLGTPGTSPREPSHFGRGLTGQGCTGQDLSLQVTLS